MTDREERHQKIVNGIVDFSEIFETFALNGKPIFTNNIRVPTAAICFNQKGLALGFIWNSSFFDSCSDYKAKFILCHEMLHIFLKHGIRGLGLTNHSKANIAMDLSINHLLVDEFGFNRGQIEGWEDLCWRDTVFSEKIEHLPCFESYYNLDDKFFKDNISSIDIHDFLVPDTKLDDKLQIQVDEASKKLLDILPSAGTDAANLAKDIDVTASKKPKFENLVKRIAASAIEIKKEKLSSWTTLDRRFSYIAPDMPAIDDRHERKCPAKYKCAFFIDNSGSCTSFIKRFTNVAATLNPKVFDTTIYSFDTIVSEVKIVNGKYRVIGGGGTCFECIGRKVEETNPDVVFVLTDGWASYFSPKNKHKYFWFLVERSTDACIKNAGKIYRLSQYE